MLVFAKPHLKFPMVTTKSFTKKTIPNYPKGIRKLNNRREFP